MLSGKTVIVTGSSTGIGEATARLCSAEGASVLVHGRDQARAQAVKDALPGRAEVCIADLSSPDAPPAIIEACVRSFGGVSGIVNNAALTLRGDIGATDAALWDKVMAVNARAPFLMLKAGLEELKRSKGSVVNIGSVNAYTGEANQLAYSAAKGALMALTRNTADQLCSTGVRVNVLNVGWVLTPNEYELKIKEGLPADWPEHPDPGQVPRGMMTKPEEVAWHVAFWLSDRSAPATGSVVDLEQFPIIGRNPPKHVSQHRRLTVRVCCQVRWVSCPTKYHQTYYRHLWQTMTADSVVRAFNSAGEVAVIMSDIIRTPITKVTGPPRHAPPFGPLSHPHDSAPPPNGRFPILKLHYDKFPSDTKNCT